MSQSDFTAMIRQGYAAQNGITIGAGIFEGNVVPEASVTVPIKMLNRHGLIAGATGTGKTVTLQMLAENLSLSGVPVLLMDLKGDLSGISQQAGSNAKTEARLKQLGMPFRPASVPVEFMTLSDGPGVRLRATVSEFGPVLFSRMLELNDTQAGVMAILFRFADDRQLPLVDLQDIRKLIQHCTNEGKKELQERYGMIPPASASTILRKITALEGQKADLFFGEPSFEIEDLLHVREGKGQVSVIRLSDMQGRPALFSTFMLCMLAEIYQTLPEMGDPEKPRLCLFIDEAHLVFRDAGKELMNQIESIIKLIRSKGVGIFFVTQHPTDIPDTVLAQLGLKVQHALRAFTEKDRKAIRKSAENYPRSQFYRTDEILTTLGTGQALVTALDENGIPTPLAAVHLRPPATRIGTITSDELNVVTAKSALAARYGRQIDRESAYDILSGQMNEAVTDAQKEKRPSTKKERSIIEDAGVAAAKQAGRTIARELARGLLGVLGFGGRRKKGWF